MKNLISFFVAMMVCLFLLNGCIGRELVLDDGTVLGTVYKLDVDEKYTASKVLKQNGEVIWLEGGAIFYSKEFSKRELVGKKVSYLGTSEVIYRYSDNDTKGLIFNGEPIREVVNKGRAMSMRIVTTSSSTYFMKRSFVIIDDGNQKELVRTNVYLMREKH